jgi:hypothetical protein
MMSAPKNMPRADRSCETNSLELGLTVILGPTSKGKSTLTSIQFNTLMEVPRPLLVDWSKSGAVGARWRAHAGDDAA